MAQIIWQLFFRGNSHVKIVWASFCAFFTNSSGHPASNLLDEIIEKYDGGAATGKRAVNRSQLPPVVGDDQGDQMRL
jgi:hypothetical protein